MLIDNIGSGAPVMSESLVVLLLAPANVSAWRVTESEPACHSSLPTFRWTALCSMT